MATPAGRLVQDQNFSIHSAGGPSLGGKVDVSKAAKKGANGRKALNDISNSGKPSALQASKKHNSINVIPVGKDAGGSKTGLPIGGKANSNKAPEKVKSRKALSDLTNSGKPSVQHLSKKGQEQKLNVTAEETIPNAIKEEKFLHNHQDCIKAQQRKGMNFAYFLETVGLGTPMVLPQPLKLKPESPMKHFEIEIPDLEEEEIPVLLSDRRGKAEFPDCSSPVYGSPKYEFWKHEEDLADFKLIESPKWQKH